MDLIEIQKRADEATSKIMSNAEGRSLLEGVDLDTKGEIFSEWIQIIINAFKNQNNA